MVFAGSIIDYGGSTIPFGYLACDGSAVSRITYARLFNKIGTTFGAGDGTTTFNLPDLRGRVSIGSGSGTGLTPRAIGSSGGEEAHIVTQLEMASHTHTQNSHNHTKAYSDSYNGSGSNKSLMTTGGIETPVYYTSTDDTVATNQNTGGDAAHNNMQPSLVVAKLIKF